MVKTEFFLTYKPSWLLYLFKNTRFYELLKEYTWFNIKHNVNKVSRILDNKGEAGSNT
jgi:hypothetical protein